MCRIENLPWDSEFFGFGVARVEANSIYDLQNLDLNEDIKLLYIFSDSNELPLNLVDEKRMYSRDTKILEHSANTVSLFDMEFEKDDIYSLGIQSGQYSRFKFDKKIGSENFTKLYKTWVDRSLDKSIAKDIFVIKERKSIAGFLTYDYNDKDANIGLVAVNSEYRGKGYGVSLVNSAIARASEDGLENITVVTQGINKAAVKLYEKTGFTLLDKKYIYHLWID